MNLAILQPLHQAVSRIVPRRADTTIGRVARPLVAAASRIVSTHGELGDYHANAQDSVSPAVHRHECRRGTQECVRHDTVLRIQPILAIHQSGQMGQTLTQARLTGGRSATRLRWAVRARNSRSGNTRGLRAPLGHHFYGLGVRRPSARVRRASAERMTCGDCPIRPTTPNGARYSPRSPETDRNSTGEEFQTKSRRRWKTSTWPKC